MIEAFGEAVLSDACDVCGRFPSEKCNGKNCPRPIDDPLVAKLREAHRQQAQEIGKLHSQIGRLKDEAVKSIEQKIRAAFEDATQAPLGATFDFSYCNYRGEAADRKVRPYRVYFGSTEWHPEPQWFMRGFDVQKQADRDFAMLDISPLKGPDISPSRTFQKRVAPWMLDCFGYVILRDRQERNHRFFEEATELVQSGGMTRSEAHQLVNYTYDRPTGAMPQEVGGVMVTLAALCLANDLDMHHEAEVELARINQPETISKIRAKQAAKPKHSPLPEHAPGEKP